MNTPPDIRLKPVHEDDEHFVKTLTLETVGPYIDKTWSDEKDRKACFDRIDHRNGKRSIITKNNENIGFLCIQDRSDHIFLDQIYIDKKFQGQGIGQHILYEIIHEAEQLKLPIKLIVLRVNPAIKLYRKLGFEIYEQDKDRYYLERIIKAQ